jgi:hypothetical protein
MTQTTVSDRHVLFFEASFEGKVGCEGVALNLHAIYTRSRFSV